ncbi:MAG: substrate-binding domain-containing protein [Bryobacteraceae bacterium]|jgi:molybdate transport system substrate-binding protein
MHKPLRWVFITALLASPVASFAQLHVLISGGFSAAFKALQPEFSKTTGITVDVARGQSQGTGPTTIGAQLARGVPADVVIMSREGLDDLIAQGRIVPATAVNLAQTPLGMSVRAGASKPDISTVGAFRQTLLRAQSITFPSSTTGIYMTTRLFPQLGIAAQISGKITHTGVAAVAAGEAEIAIQPVSELLQTTGVDFVGTIPAPIQFISVFSAALVKGAKEPATAQRLIAFLVSENAAAAIRQSGMEPSKSR